MSDTIRFMFLNLPNPRGRNINRGNAGGFGTLGNMANATLLPIYLLYATSAAINSGCNYCVLDAQALRYNSSQVVEAVKTNVPDALISWVSLPSLNHDISVLDRIKEAFPNILVIVLGAVCNVMPEEILLKSSVNFIVKGSYPHYRLMLRLIDFLKRNPLDQKTLDKEGAVYLKEGNIIQNAQPLYNEDLDQLSFDAYYQLPVNRYLSHIPDANGSIIKYIPLLTSIGCPYSCMYCPYPVGYGHYILHKSIMRIIDEIEFLKTKFGISGFLFRDQLFTHDKERVQRLCDEIILRKLNIKWFVEARVDEVSEILLKKMKEAGCFRIHYGVETGAPEMLEKEGKPGVQIETVKNAFWVTKKFGIATGAHMIVGLPGENEETIRNSLSLLCEIKPNNAYVNIATPYPGTRLYKISKEQGWISTYDWSKYTSFTAVLHTGKLNAAQVNVSTKNLTRRFRSFKLLSDTNYRNYYAKELPREILNRIKMFMKF